MPDSKWIEIARTGTFNDSAGRPQTFTDADLARIASSYDPQRRDCPLVIGHVTSDSAPAYGWLSKIKAQNGKLLAQFAQVPDEVRDLVAKGHYRHVSMSLMPDRVTLRHVALLGAAQPAIDCLKAVELRAGDADITVDFSTTGAHPPQQKEKTIPEDLQREIGALKERLASLEKENATLKEQAKSHREGREKAEGEKREAEARAEKAASDFAAYREKIEGEKLEARVSELVRAGKITPAEKPAILEFAARLDSQSDSIDFSAPEGKTEKVSMREHYLRGLEAKIPDPRGMNFSAPPMHSLEGQSEINPGELTGKL